MAMVLRQNVSMDRPRQEALRQGLSDVTELRRLPVYIMCYGLVKHSKELLRQSPSREEGPVEI